jgi:FkbM family methyltransferase
MHYSLILVGAHDGSKTLPLIADASKTGKVLLVEPVPFLFERLQKNVAQLPNIALVNACVSLVDGIVEFTAPKEDVSSPTTFFDQLGSLSADHATNHDPRMASHIEVILAESRTFATLLREHGVTSIDTLFTDTEGYDCELLPTFPFQSMVPKRIVFEYKHADGTFRIGRKLGNLLIALDILGYDIAVQDLENMVAVLRSS